MKEISAEEATRLMEHTEDPSVFVDRGWGDDPDFKESITVISGGDGQHPLAHISRETLNALRDSGVLGPNCLITYKARKLYPFIRAAAEIGKQMESATK